ncbi:GNAT family N-acetyltransferase [Blastococcus sp. CT_GayMR16]|uniref:GNAT family N-acetyltransferase n=1 Tax=Blastococcus sp. CT_GayMR16 TaxID=2559607 RepID=UPI001073BF76|nr:GNAT family N-acetyltransferase [Blastococcus sp. CT_GayMR16]TFV89945.1 N-acetyltransferase [Blastococcus sp. CT_GayMR16]
MRTARLVLEPLRIDHAAEAAQAFDDDRLHTFTGGKPATEAELRTRYSRQAGGHSPDGGETWLNWVLRRRDTGELIGTVQATVTEAGAELAWVVAVPHQGCGYAREAALAVQGDLRRAGISRFSASIHPDHRASAGVARALGMAPSGTVVAGEIRWTDG